MSDQTAAGNLPAAFYMENIMKKLLFFVGVLTTSLLLLAGCASSGSTYGAASGSATVTADGFGGPIKVTVTLEKGKIVNVEVDGPFETQGIGSRAVASLPAQMMKKKTVEVDTVSGATVSSNGILEAARAAVAQIK